MGFGFRVLVADVDESTRPGESPDAYLERIVLAKLDAVAARFRGGATEGHVPAVLLVADTSVVADDVILGKPDDDDHAKRMLRRLSGAVHHVMTRFAIGTLDSELRLVHAQTVRTAVTFRPLDDATIERYVATGEGRDKAGAYAIQGGAASFVPRIEGSYSNVVGLPACEVAVVLASLGFW